MSAARGEARAPARLHIYTPRVSTSRSNKHTQRMRETESVCCALQDAVVVVFCAMYREKPSGFNNGWWHAAKDVYRFTPEETTRVRRGPFSGS